jgi:hypothetical protein
VGLPAAQIQLWEVIEADELREMHRTLYRFLSRYFRQRPALWESRFRARSSG